MAKKKFGQSLFTILLNPVGYALQRKSSNNSALDYYKYNDPGNVLTGTESEAQYLQKRADWCDACAAELKSNDVLMSRNNAISACEAQWNSSSAATIAVQRLNKIESINASNQAKVNENNKAIIMLLAALSVLIVFLIYAFKNIK